MIQNFYIGIITKGAGGNGNNSQLPSSYLKDYPIDIFATRMQNVFKSEFVGFDNFGGVKCLTFITFMLAKKGLKQSWFKKTTWPSLSA